MTREELKAHCERQIQEFERVEKIMPVTPNAWKHYEEHKLVLELLEQEPCTDAVSREAVIGLYENYRPSLATHVTEFGDALKALPTVIPERPKGEWILSQRGKYVDITCSCCRSIGVESYGYNYSVNDLSEYEAREFAENSRMYFCKVCGADMRGGKK